MKVSNPYIPSGPIPRTDPAAEYDRIVSGPYNCTLTEKQKQMLRDHLSGVSRKVDVLSWLK